MAGVDPTEVTGVLQQARTNSSTQQIYTPAILSGDSSAPYGLVHVRKLSLPLMLLPPCRVQALSELQRVKKQLNQPFATKTTVAASIARLEDDLRHKAHVGAMGPTNGGLGGSKGWQLPLRRAPLRARTRGLCGQLNGCRNGVGRLLGHPGGRNHRHGHRRERGALTGHPLHASRPSKLLT